MREALTRAYQQKVEKGCKDILEYSICELAGYYLMEFPKKYLQAFYWDLSEYRITTVVGFAVENILKRMAENEGFGVQQTRL